LEKAAQIVTYPHSAKISQPKPNLKVRNIYNKPLLKPENTCCKPCFEIAYLGEKVKNLLEQKGA